MLSNSEKIAVLKRTRLLADFSAGDVRKITDATQEVSISDGENLFIEGEQGDALYLIVHGRIGIHKAGKELVTRSDGECVGEMAVIDDGPRSASATALGDVLLLKMGRDDFRRLLKEETDLSQGILKTVLQKFREDIDQTIEVARRHERMMQDIARARELQMNILPTQDLRVTHANGSTLEASGCCYPAEMVGGDYYDYFSLSDHQVAVVIGDVMGHGFHTGLMVSTAKSCLHTQIQSDYTVPKVMSVMNEMVYRFVHSQLFMSFCYIIIDLDNHTMSFSNAGHPYPCHYRAATGQLAILESDTFPLGIMGGVDYETTVSEWHEGDVLALYTDGIIEAQNREGEDFGEERLKRLIIENAHLSPADLKATVLGELDSHCQGITQADDVSLAVVKMG